MNSDWDGLLCADLFCGAGGTSTGLLQAADEIGIKVKLVAVNHWQIAIETHELNHANVRHFNSDLETLDPRKAVPEGYLDVLVASPECTFHSNALGGKPMNDQSRASARYILKWCDALNIKEVRIENVPEFRNWGPLHRCTCGTDDPKKHRKGFNCLRPIKSRKGELYRRFIRDLEVRGYTVRDHVLVAANYGDPTTRKRLFIAASKSGVPTFPAPTHSENPDLFVQNRWIPVERVIDWSVKGKSIFGRKRPLSPNTLRRIAVGLEKSLMGAFILGQQSGARGRGVDKPLPTIASKGAIALIEPFLIETRGTNKAALARSSKSTADPVTTITGTNHHWLIEPFIIQSDFGGKVLPVNAPLNTITSIDARALIQPFLVEYYGTGKSCPVNKPLKTQTGRDRFGLIQPVLVVDGKRYVLEILHRMLMVKELAAATSFPADYQFAGTREDAVKQIGNAVPVLMAKALLLETFKHLQTHYVS